MAVAVDHHHGFKPFFRPPRCKLPSYSQLDYTMLESDYNHTNHLKKAMINHAFELASIHKSFSTPCLSISTRLEESLDHHHHSNSRIEIVGGQGAPKVRALVLEVAIAMASSVSPEPVPTGLGGAYFLRARNGDKIAVAKPIDEEPLAFNNPKGFAGQMLGQPGMKRSIRVGEAGLRELAAYLLDHGGFSGVPPTALVKLSHVKFNVNTSDQSFVAPPYKIASLQRFVEHDSDAGDLGPSGFSVGSIHRIGILDVRLLNLDRHAGNILVKRVPAESYSSVGVADLVPIDHGFCLPESLDDPYFEWLHWPQALIPFSESELEYISSLDPFKDAELLRTELPSIRESAIRVFVLCTSFLKQAADFGMCLADIGEMMTREFQGGEENRSALENACMDAKAGLSSRMNEVSDADEVFEFDDENEDSSNKVFDNDDQVLVQSSDKQQKIRRLSSETSMMKFSDTLLFAFEEEENSQNGGCDSNKTKELEGKKKDENGGDSCKAGGFMRSMSFAVPDHINDNGGISFGEMSNEEWETFLEIFKKLLPKFFVGRKSMCLSKKRLGNSCEF